MILLLLACVAEPVPQDAPRARLSDVRLEVDERLVVSAVQAVVDDDGVVSGEVVSASLAQEPAPEEVERPPLEIDAPRSEWDMRSRTIVFSGGVTAVRGEVTLICDELTVRMRDADEVDEARAVGSVRVTRGQRVATGREAVLRGATGEVLLTGEPVLSEGVNRMTGERITLFLDDERVVCDACRLVVEGDALLQDAP